jgi:hypothetical protein
MSGLKLDLERYRAAMPSQVAAHADPARPAPQRLVAARGMLPLATQDQLAVLVALCDAAETPVAEAARTTLSQMPANLVKPVLTNAATPGWLLEGLGCKLNDRGDLLPDLLSHRATPDRIHIWASVHAETGLAHERLCLDLQRLKRCPEIIEGLWNNESVDRYLLRPAVEFLVREGMHLETVPLFKEVLASLNFEELQQAVDNVELPTEVQHMLRDKAGELEEGDEVDETELHRAVNDDEADDSTPLVDTAPKKKLTIIQVISSMTPAQKICLGLKGNREARTILIRDSNKLVCTAVVRSPRISEREIALAATMRSIHEEVIRIICNNRDWMRKYPIKVALVNNPKTPLARSMALIKSLHQRELKAISRSTSVPSALRSAAKRLLSQKRT